MIDLKKKCWREKVTAEITMTHIQQIAEELGANMSAAEVAKFFNHDGRAQIVWTYMMQAAEQYIKSSLETKGAALPGVSQSGNPVTMIH
ncbi:MAG TPA: hypothetical protein VIH91_00050 [Terriglobales bacterium]